MKEEKKYVKRLKMITSNIWYIVALVALVTAVIMLIVNWSSTLTALRKVVQVLMPFFLGFLFAYLINPLVRLFEKLFNLMGKDKALTVKKVFSMLLSYIIVLGAITVIIVFITPQIVTSVNQLGQTVQKGYDYVKLHPTSFLDWIPFANTADIMEKLKDNINSIAINMGSKVFPYLYSTFTSTFVIAYDIFFGLVISIYLTWEKDQECISADL